MKMGFIKCFLLAVIICVSMSGCRPGVGRLDAQDRSLTLMRKAAARKTEGEIDEAVSLYKKSLLANPEAARAHLDLALVLHDHKADFVPAIYHYRRYIELRPDTEKREMIEDRIRLAMQTFSAKSNKMQQERIASLGEIEQKNAELKDAIELLQARNAKLEKENQKLRTLAKAQLARRSQPPASPRTYRVRRGDSLLSIASEVYGDSSKWVQIYNENRDVIKNKDHLPVNTVLKIP